MAWRDVKKHIPQPQKVIPPARQKEEAPLPKNLPRGIELSAPEFIYYEKTADWYWSLGIITVALFVIAILGENFLFGFLVILGAFTVGLFASKRPRIIRIAITMEGVLVDNKLFPFEEIKSFWIFYRAGGIKELSLELDKRLAPHIKIPIGDINPSDVRDFLIQYVREKAQEESLIDIIAHRLQF